MSTGLPIEDVIDEIRAALQAGDSLVVTAPPGSGKTTVVPLRLLAESWRRGKIVVLEPRRIATRSAAARMAFLLGEDVGDTVGYVTRNDRRTGPTTAVEVVTEGVLTRRLQRDPSLPGTAAVIFDEIHERNLQTDLGLALALEARAAVRPDLKLIAMSATIAAPELAGLLGGDTAAPVVSADAELHPVDIRWVPLPRRGRLDDHAAGVVRRAIQEAEGDVLVFLPGMGEIRRVQRRLDGVTAHVRILHGSLSAAEQDAAIAPSPPGSRKIVLSTDIAESSLTVEGVRIVVDAGLNRSPQLDTRTGMTRLKTLTASRASADQRAGRAGRLGPGVVYRLWSKLEHGTRRPDIEPEIARVDLAGLALELAAWGAPDPSTLRLPTAPPPRNYAEGVDLLRSLGAVDASGRLTDTGRAMAELPVHPRLARMIVAAGPDAAVACVLAALVDGRDVIRGRPEDVPVDLSLRARLVVDERASYPGSDDRGLDRVRREARDLARRAGVSGPVDPAAAGRALALAYPDRLAVRRGSPGRFQLRTGGRAWVLDTDPLAPEQFLVAADLDGNRREARIRLAASISADDVADRFADEVTTSTALRWVDDRLVARRERKIGGLVLDTSEQRPPPSAEVAGELLTRVTKDELRPLRWTAAARHLVERVAFLHRSLGDPWPDWSQPGLVASAEEWLAPHLTVLSGLDEIAQLDVHRILRAALPYPDAARLDELAPRDLVVPTGRSVPIDYSGEIPAVSVRVQEMFGTAVHPTLGGVPVVLELLSPADRPIQVTSDLAGFWDGSWHDVRKEMAGRYPKHAWPDDPVTADPHRN